MSMKITSARKLLHEFIETLDVKHNTVVWRFGAAKSKSKAIKKVNMLWSHIKKRRGHTK